MRPARRQYIFLFTFLIMFSLASAFEAQAQGKGKGNSRNKGKSSNVSPGRSGKADDSPVGKPGKGKGSDDHVNNGPNRYRGLSKKVGGSPDKMQAWYEAEKLANPDLTYGQFVAANMIARTRSGIPAQYILDGLRNGDSIGQVLHQKGLSRTQIDYERRRIKKAVLDDPEIGPEYDDRDIWWRIKR